MLWDLRFDRDQAAVEGSFVKRRPPPGWYLDRPFILDVEDFYLRAFFDLNGARPLIIPPMGGQPVLCALVWSEIRAYGQFYELDHDVLRAFIRVVQAMDVGYLTWKAEQRTMSTSKSAPTPPAGG